MHFDRKVTKAASVVALISLIISGSIFASSSFAAVKGNGHHALLISVDGMHQADLKWYISAYPNSTFADLVKSGVEFTNALTPFPSDSFPGMVGQVTGGNPKSTGIYYDVSYNKELIDPNASKDVTPSAAFCASAPKGAVISFDESLDSDMSKLDAGQGLALPQDILKMTGKPQTLINPLGLPIDPKSCSRIYPHQYLKVNTIFEVAKANGLHTAWIDKHAAYEILGGPSGNGIDDLFTPEINSDAGVSGGDWTKINSLTQMYDDFKVKALLNEINGFDHSGKTKAGLPSIFGMNFQSVSTAEKLPLSDGLLGGYDATGTIPGPILQSAMGFVDRELSVLLQALKGAGHVSDTTIILSAKHGQSPMDLASLKRINDGTITDALNTAWQSQHAEQVQPLVSFSLNDDGMLLWFSPGNQTSLAAGFASDYLRNYGSDGTGADGMAKATDSTTAPIAYTSAGLSTIYAGEAAAKYMGVSITDSRVPDLIGVVQHGVVYTGKTKKIAEHGGADMQDRHVPLIISGGGFGHGVNSKQVETIQIAPTILNLLGLDPKALQAVKREGTKALTIK